MKKKAEFVVVGAGLAGLSCALELAGRGREVIVLEAKDYVGGRCANWNEHGMEVESGFHRFIGYYRVLPSMLEKSGVNLNRMLFWEESMEVRIPDRDAKAVFGLAPVHGPIKMLKGLFGNQQVLSARDKLSLVPFMAAGFKDFFMRPKWLDQYSVLDYARRHGVSPKSIQYVLTPLGTGIFFQPLDEYSATVFFGLFAPALPRFYSMRIGAFRGGMTDVMSGPMADAIEKRGGHVFTGRPVKHLLVRHGRVHGVQLDHDEVEAGHVVVATSLRPAQKLLQEHFEDDEWYQPLRNMCTMPAVTIQFDLDRPLMPKDRTTFGPGTCLASFAEQSRTTFPEAPGRLSIILAPPERFLNMEDEEVKERVLADAERLRIPLRKHALDYRVIRHSDDFHHLGPGQNQSFPDQRTPVPGLTLAGDYTRQPYYSTMEGAAVSGVKAAEIAGGRRLS